MKRILALLLAALMTIPMLSGCRIGDDGAYVPTGDGLTWDDPEHSRPTEPEREQELTMVYTPSESYNPYLTTNQLNRAWMSLIYQGLFATDSNYKTWPILCESYWMSGDMQTYIFYLRPDATFSDGTPVTVADVMATLQYAMDTQLYSGRFTHVVDIYPAGSGIAVDLDTPYENFPLLLDIPILKATQLTDPEPLGTGPYRMNRVTSGMRLVRVGTWWESFKRLPITATAITLLEAKNSVQIRDEFELGDVDLVRADPGSPDFAAYRCDYELWDCENGDFLYLGVNTDGDLFGNATLRQALTHGIDREKINNEFYHGLGLAANLATSPLSPYYDATLAASYGYDLEKFTQAVTAAGATGSTVRILVNSADNRRVRIARSLGAMMAAGGLVPEIVEYTGNDYTYTLAIRNYDLHLGETRLSPNMDLSPFFSGGGSLNYGNMGNPRLAALCLDALANKGNFYNLLKDVAADGRLVPIIFGSYTVYGERGVATNLRPARDNLFFYQLGVTMAQALLHEQKTD